MYNSYSGADYSRLFPLYHYREAFLDLLGGFYIQFTLHTFYSLFILWQTNAGTRSLRALSFTYSISFF